MSEFPRSPFASISSEVKRHPDGTGWNRVPRMVAFLCWAAVLICLSPTVLAQDYPNRPIKLLVGYAPGGGSDVIARLVARQLQLRLGQPVVVENKPGTRDGRVLLVDGLAIQNLDLSHVRRLLQDPQV